ncbi:hypothetical protein Tco_1262505 [Tanacetum coccineum]
MLEIKQVNQYAQALSSIPAIVDRYIDNKLGEAINKAIQAHNLNYRKEAHDEKNAYIELVDTSMRALIKEEINTQLPQILPQAVSDFANPVIEKNVTESLEAAVLTRSSSQPKSTYEAAASLFEFELTKILIDKMEKNKSYDKADYRKKLYDTLLSLITLTKIYLIHMSAHAEEPSHTVDDSGVQQDQEFDTVNNDEQPTDKEVTKDDWFKKPERPPTPDSDWNKRQHLMDTSFDLTAFVLNRLNIKDLTQEILVGLAFELLKGTCKSLTELEYYLEEYQRGRQIIPQDFFINNDIEYLKGGDLSRRPVKVIYDKHAYWGISHWGPKRQHFYGFAANMTSSKDVYSKKRIIAVTRLSIMEKYDYGHLEEIEVHKLTNLINDNGTDISKITRKQSKNGQARTREQKSVQKPEAMIKP